MLPALLWMRRCCRSGRHHERPVARRAAAVRLRCGCGLRSLPARLRASADEGSRAAADRAVAAVEHGIAWRTATGDGPVPGRRAAARSTLGRALELALLVELASAAVLPAADRAAARDACLRFAANVDPAS